MEDAGDELSTRASSLKVVITETQLTDRLVCAFEIQNLTADVSLRLFEVSHRLDQSYPVVIDPPEPDIPAFLSRKKFIPGTRGLAETMTMPLVLDTMSSMIALKGSPGRYVDDKWVCSTPAEFRAKLTDLFSQDHVKVRIISLIAPTLVQHHDAGATAEVDDASQADAVAEDDT